MIRLCVLLICASSLPAAELVVRDLELGVEAGAPRYSYTVSGNSVDASGSDSWSQSANVHLDGRWSFTQPGHALGLVLGIGIADDINRSDSEKLSTDWGRVSAGVGWAVNDSWTLIAEVGGREGRSSLHQAGSIYAGDFTATGRASGYDAAVEATWRFSHRLCVEVDGGWLIDTQHLSGEGLQVILRQSGWFVGLDMVWRFSNAPPALQ